MEKLTFTPTLPLWAEKSAMYLRNGGPLPLNLPTDDRSLPKDEVRFMLETKRSEIQETWAEDGGPGDEDGIKNGVFVQGERQAYYTMDESGDGTLVNIRIPETGYKMYYESRVRGQRAESISISVKQHDVHLQRSSYDAESGRHRSESSLLFSGTFEEYLAAQPLGELADEPAVRSAIRAQYEEKSLKKILDR